MANYYTLLSTLFPVGSPENVAPALALYRQFRDELEEADEWIGFAAQADDAPGSADLWLHADEDADIVLSFVGQEIAADPAVAGRFGAFLATVSGEPDCMAAAGQEP